MGRVYLDFTGFDRLYGEAIGFGKKIIESIESDFSLKSRLGIATNKLVSKAATNKAVITSPLFEVKDQQNQSFLNPFPVATLPVIRDIFRESPPDVIETFDDLSLESVHDLKKLDLLTLAALFPCREKIIYEMARGIDFRTVNPPKLETTIFFDIHIDETNDGEYLLEKLFHLADQVCFLSRRKRQKFKSLKIALRYSDFKYRERFVELKQFTNYSHEIHDEIRKSFYFLLNRRTRVRYLMVEASSLVVSETQLNLFDDPKKKIFDTMDEINIKFPQSISRGRWVK
jgi:DNA polymerase-4